MDNHNWATGSIEIREIRIGDKVPMSERREERESRPHAMTSVSVIIPCYRQARFLAEAIDSVLAQTTGNAEIVVVDDGSPDYTERVTRRYPMVQYLRQPNRGPSAARNQGLQAARGSYVVFLDADDRLLPHHFETSLRAFDEHPDAACITGDYRWFGAEGTWHVHDCQPRPDYYGTLLRSNFIGPPHPVMFKRSVVLELGGFRADLRAFEDLDLYLRLARRFPMYCHHQPVALYRRHTDQSSLNCDIMLRSGIEVLRSQRPYLDRHPQYREAYRLGIRHTQQIWGTPIVWDMLGALRMGQVRRGLQCLAVLLRWYPKALVELLQRKVAVIFHRAKSPA
jgi:glycosyltransferase involved in cell wall biosynthesis